MVAQQDLNTIYPIVTSYFLESLIDTTLIALEISGYDVSVTESEDDKSNISDDTLYSTYSKYLNNKISIGDYIDIYRSQFPSLDPIQFIEYTYSTLLHVRKYIDKHSIILPKQASELFPYTLSILQLASQYKSLSKILSHIDSQSHPIHKRLEILQYQSNISDIRTLFENVKIKCHYCYIKDSLDNLLDKISDTSQPLHEFLNQIESAASNFVSSYSKSKQISRVDISAFSLQSADMDHDKLTKHIFHYAKLLVSSKYIATPFPKMTSIMRGGFAPTRLYVVGGPSGAGKSTFLLDSALCYVTNMHNDLDVNKPGTVLFITIENLMHETLCRLASWVNKQDLLKQAYDKRYKNRSKIVSYITEEIAKAITHLKQTCLRNIEIRYVVPSSSCLSDIRAIIDDVANECQKNNIPLEFIVIDFINPIAQFADSSLLRHKLGEIARVFKNISIDYQSPVLTAAHLRRTAYDSSVPLSVSEMGESMQIVENSDGVILLRQTGSAPHIKLYEIRVGKLRYTDDVVLQAIVRKGTYHFEECSGDMLLSLQQSSDFIKADNNTNHQSFNINKQQFRSTNSNNNDFFSNLF